MKSLRQCLACGREMMFDEWYPEMLCETCEQEIDSAFTDEDIQDIQEGLEYPDECY